MTSTLVDSADAPVSGIDTLTALHRTGRLATEYPLVQGLLATVPAAHLQRAGRLLAGVPPEEVQRHHPNVPVVSVAITGHGTLPGLVSTLTVELARHGVLLRSHLSNFDTYAFELSDPGSELFTAVAPDVVLCVLDPNVVLDELPLPWTTEDAARVLDEKLALFERLAATADSAAVKALVLNTIPLSRTVLAQLVDYRSRAELGALWREANARLLRLPTKYPSLIVLDTDAMAAEGALVTEPRMSTYAKAHLSPDLLRRYACDAAHLVRHLLGRTRKCLVLDLDETVWGGILGDDGPHGIEVADTHRGEAFSALQRVAKQLAAQGVLLAAVSKNDLEPVRTVLREHPRMTLREEDFVRVVANWEPKSNNLAELAVQLNLGLDSFVFADDSPYECGLIRHALPEVAVVALDDPAFHVTRLLADGWFDTRQVTAEDRRRTVSYRDELARKEFQSGFDSLESYLNQLGVRVRLASAQPLEVARLSQITLRTNQFNLTTRRLQPEAVAALMADPQTPVLTVHAGDRFGDNGLVGSVLLRWAGEVLHIENFLLSCRVFARGVEQACLNAVLRHARSAGAIEVIGHYRPTAKNGKFRGFYTLNGFVERSGDGTDVLFGHDLTDIGTAPAYVRLTEEIEETRR
ncbi:HAD-IIIC family phosphatase [Micromonospora sp. DT233]|uniref:HAD-IIIC family phosphatase n=1 Tax=Micromonospora sp. DT233 TaxID=3393432 RepID=UPI003CEB518C